MAKRGKRAQQVDEFWKPIPIFEGYEASSEGRIRFFNPKSQEWEFVEARPEGKEYFRVSLRHNGKMHELALHRVICRTFKGPPPTEKHEVAHSDGNAANNRSNNLRWATRSENIVDAVRHGRSGAIGTAGADYIRNNYHRKSIEQLAKKFGVGVGAIHDVIAGRTYRIADSFVEPEPPPTILDELGVSKIMTRGVAARV
jgi:hypothetical protein